MGREVNGQAASHHEMLLELIGLVDEVARTSGCRYFMAYGTLLGAIRHSGFIPWDTDVDLYVVIDDLPLLCAALAKVDPARYEVLTRESDSSYTKLLPRLTFRGADHHDIHVDLFPLVGAPENPLMRRLHVKLGYLLYRSFNVKMSNPSIRYRTETRKRWLVTALKLMLFPVHHRVIEQSFQRLQVAVPFEGASSVRNSCGSYGHREPFPSTWLKDPALIPFENLELLAPREWDLYLRQMYGDYEVPRTSGYLA